MFEDVRVTALDLGRRLNTDINKIVEELYGDMDLPPISFDLRIDEGL